MVLYVPSLGNIYNGVESAHEITTEPKSAVGANQSAEPSHQVASQLAALCQSVLPRSTGRRGGDASQLVGVSQNGRANELSTPLAEGEGGGTFAGLLH